ncbi:MAG: AAA family ATPase [Saprospiraceae bacterium]
MRIDKIEINNFRCFEHLELELHPQLNVFVGLNGSGKTALLEALKVSLGGVFLGMNSGWTPNVKISREDVFYSKYSKNLEPKPPAEVSTIGSLNERTIKWKRTLKSASKFARTYNKDASEIKIAVEELAQKVKDNEPNAILPIIAYFTTDRLCHCNALEFDGTYGSRFRGYDLCMEAMYSFEMGEWYKTQELSRLQAIRHKEESDLPELDVVQRAIAHFVPKVLDVYFDFTRETVCLKFEDGAHQPIETLSDGFKNLLVLVSDLTIRCLMLNPELGLKANEVQGVVLIDEVDLHLHPSWQRQVIPKLLKSFPNVQFFITTHSPQVISGVPKESIFILKDFKVERGSVFTEGRDSNSLLQDVFEVPELEEQYQKELNDIYALIDQGDKPQAEQLLAQLLSKRGEGDREIQRIMSYLEFL